MNEKQPSTNRYAPWRQVLLGIGLGIGALAVAAVLLLWAWNGFAAALFGAPEMLFRHALAAELLVAIVAVTAAVAARRGRHHDGVAVH